MVTLNKSLTTISKAFTKAGYDYTENTSEERTLGLVKYEKPEIKNYDSMEKKAVEVRDFKDSLVGGISHSLAEIAKTKFSENEELDVVETTHEFAGDKLTVSIVRSDEVIDGDNIVTVDNNIRVFSETSLCTSIDDVRKLVWAEEDMVETDDE